MNLNQVTYAIIGCATRVHSVLGPGLLESAYHACLLHELKKSGLVVRDHVRLPVMYDGVRVEFGYEADLIVNEAVIVELKAIERIHKVHEAQLLSYLVLSGLTVGLLINFHELHLKDAIRRVVHRFQDH